MELMDDVIALRQERQLERTMAWQLMKSLQHGLRRGLGCSLSDFKLPEQCVARPLESGEIRFFCPVLQRYCITSNLEGQSVRAELPDDDVKVLCLFPDRQSSGWAFWHYLSDAECQLVLDFDGDECHDEWNACKWAAGRTHWWAWLLICKMSLMLSVNKAPYGSGSFRRVREDSFESFVEEGCRSQLPWRHYTQAMET